MRPETVSISGSRKVEPKPSRKRKRAPSDLRRRAQRNTQQLAESRKDRCASWPEGGQDVFAAERQEIKLARLYGEKRTLRRDVRDAARLPDGAPYSGRVQL